MHRIQPLTKFFGITTILAGTLFTNSLIVKHHNNEVRNNPNSNKKEIRHTPINDSATTATLFTLGLLGTIYSRSKKS